MAATYITKADDALDQIIWRYYNRQDNGLLEAVLEANRGLADYGPVLPAGITIILPVAEASQPAERLQLFA